MRQAARWGWWARAGGGWARTRLETNARALIEALRGIPRNRHVCVEEGTLSGWLWEVLEPHVEELVVVGVREGRGSKSDKRDAFAPAEQLRIGSLETVV